VWNNLNQCQGTFTPNVKIGGNRNFSYNQNYEFCVKDGVDKAATSQTPPGPNVMDETCASFTTEVDVDSPTVISNLPAGGTTVATTANVSFTLRDVKASVPSVYGTGVDASTILVRLQGKKQGGVDFDLTLGCSSAGVTCTGLGDPLEAGHYYAYAVTLDPSYFSTPFDNFAQNTRIDVTVSGGSDQAGNQMQPYSWWFKTMDTTAPQIDDLYPLINESFCVTTASTSAQKVISFTITDDGVGVRPEDVVVRVGADYYQFGGANAARINFAGTVNSWQVTVDSLLPLFSASQPFPVTIAVTDQTSNALNPELLYALVLDCDGGTVLDPNVCAADGYCNPLCLNDPDCPGGTNCQPTTNPSPTPCTAATTCPTSNCDGKNYESCSSCCPSVSLPTYPNPEVIYRYRDYCPETAEASINDVAASPTPVPAVVVGQPYTFNLSSTNVGGSIAGCSQDRRFCNSVWFYLPWVLLVLVGGKTLHQSYHCRQLEQELQRLKNHKSNDKK
jgi:hypothetical protein